jgi:hypothetical protein
LNPVFEWHGPPLEEEDEAAICAGVSLQFANDLSQIYHNIGEGNELRFRQRLRDKLSFHRATEITDEGFTLTLEHLHMMAVRKLACKYETTSIKANFLTSAALLSLMAVMIVYLGWDTATLPVAASGKALRRREALVQMLSTAGQLQLHSPAHWTRCTAVVFDYFQRTFREDSLRTYDYFFLLHAWQMRNGLGPLEVYSQQGQEAYNSVLNHALARSTFRESPTPEGTWATLRRVVCLLSLRRRVQPEHVTGTPRSQCQRMTLAADGIVDFINAHGQSLSYDDVVNLNAVVEALAQVPPDHLHTLLAELAKERLQLEEDLKHIMPNTVM